MAATATLADALNLALRLSPLDKVRLLEQVASTLERDLTVPSGGEATATEGWGQQLVALLDGLDLSDWDLAADVDPVDWVAQQRQAAVEQRNPGWGNQS
jgi:hypothetical protein